MSRHLFLGGPWDGRVEDVDPTPHIVVPTVDRAGTCSQHTYSAHRFYLRPPTFQYGPSQTWRVYVCGPVPYFDHVLRLMYQLDVPPEIR